MRSRVSSRARLREDRAGDPLDGLVNLFDLGIVLAVAFLLAALSSIQLSPSDLKDRREPRKPQEVVVKEGEQAREVPLQPGDQILGDGEEIGKVYRLKDGRTVLVRPEPQR
jgi:hypothetical protein